MTSPADDDGRSEGGADDAVAAAGAPARRVVPAAPTLVDAAVVLALAYLVGGVLVAPLRAALDGPLGDAAAFAAFGALLGGFAVAWPLVRRGVAGLRAVAGRAPTGGHLVVGAATGLVAGVVLNVALPPLVEALLEGVGLEPPTVQQSARQALTDPGSRVVALIGVVVAAPVGEELVFRGVAFRALRRHLGAVAGAAASAGLFAALHTTGATWLGAAYLVVTLGALAITLALLVERHRHVWGAVAAHAAFNAVAVAVIWAA